MANICSCGRPDSGLRCMLIGAECIRESCFEPACKITEVKDVAFF